MENTNTTYAFLLGGGVSIFAYLVGGLDHLLLSLAIMMAADFISGILVAGKNGYEQAIRQKKTGVIEEVRVGISSKRAFIGLLKKAAMLLAIIVAVQLDFLMGNDENFMRNALIFCFIGAEGISFVENLGKIGLTLPKFIIRAFEQFSNQGKE